MHSEVYSFHLVPQGSLHLVAEVVSLVALLSAHVKECGRIPHCCSWTQIVDNSAFKDTNSNAPRTTCSLSLGLRRIITC